MFLPVKKETARNWINAFRSLSMRTIGDNKSDLFDILFDRSRADVAERHRARLSDEPQVGFFIPGQHCDVGIGNYRRQKLLAMDGKVAGRRTDVVMNDQEVYVVRWRHPMKA